MTADSKDRTAGQRARRRTADDQPTSRRDGTVGSGPVRLQDPRDIRALAHPARMAIIDALAPGDELTATDCATLTVLTPSGTAYHPNLLTRYGFAERVPARGDARERPWRATGR